MNECADKLAETALQKEITASPAGKKWRQAVIKKKVMETRQKGGRMSRNEEEVMKYMLHCLRSDTQHDGQDSNYITLQTLHCKAGGVLHQSTSKPKDLVSALKSELGGLFESLIVALMTPAISYDASQLHKALKGAGTDDDVLIEILASRTGEEIKDIIKVYKKEFSSKLEKDICGDTSGHYQKLLVILLQGSREEGIDEEKIQKDAKDLYAAGEGKVGTDEEKIIKILGNRSVEHLREVFDAYKKLSGSDIEDSLEGETTGNLENLLLAVVKCVQSVPDFFADRLYKSMRRAGTDDNTLMRIMVSRSEVDMLDIRASFKKMYGASLYSTIQEDTTGDYQKALLYLCGGND